MPTHADQPLHTAGPPPEDADATLILLHGRGGEAGRFLSLHKTLDLPKVAGLAPQADHHTWYPHPFLSPLESNQPQLDDALQRVASLVDDLIQRGIPSQRIALLGFSQGACLASEFVARHPRRYAAVMALTGGLIGPPGTPRDYPGSLAGTPVFLGCNDPDPHIPFDRVRETQTVLSHMDAEVELRRYPGLPHIVNDDEVRVCRTMLEKIAEP